jgi:DNA phosphorothioation-dependent restriction protein DptF
MGNCKLVDELNRLRKSSSDSIDGISSFDDFKKYMHVSRRAEKDLIDILHKVNASERKTLILLCGSAGDGKSHLLSYLKNEAKLLNDYTVYNDATESSSPSKTAIETLYEALEDFSDENIDGPGKNFILAINLGVLNNFIESSYGEFFKCLREYVINSNILSNKLNESGYDATSPFQHVSFSDYHMYNLTAKGVKPVYLEQILEKVFGMTDDNPFYRVYKKDCKVCPLSEKCPVKHNFEFLAKKGNREFIAHSLVEVTIKDKEILTTREILNYVYDIVVAQKFNYKKIAQSSTNAVSFLKEYVSDITPALMYEYSDMSSLLNQLRKYDPLLDRSEIADEAAIFYYVSSDVEKEIVDAIGQESYAKILCQKFAILKINDDKALKAQLFNILVRVKSMDLKQENKNAYTEFLKSLYYYNIGETKKFGELYSLVEKAIIQWCGSESNDSICFDDLHEGITLYENIDFEPYIEDCPTHQNVDELHRFLPFITVKYENKKTGDIIALDIDFSLYELIYKLGAGYIQTADDRNNHADFISFIQKILKTGSADKEITLVTEDNRRAIIERTKFGVYKFKVVK